jgi:hypothetical protein
MVIKVKLPKFIRPKRVLTVPGESLVDFSKDPAIKDPPQAARPAAPAHASTLIDHGKAPRHEDSHSPLPSAPRRPSALIDHSKVPRNEGSLSPLPKTVRRPSTLIDLGKVS